MKNQILEKRICMLIAQAYALPLEEVINEVAVIGVDKTIEQIDNKQEVKFK